MYSDDGLSLRHLRPPEWREDLQTVIIGSLWDTLIAGGRYDVVLAGLEVLRTLNDRGIETKRQIELASWTY